MFNPDFKFDLKKIQINFKENVDKFFNQSSINFKSIHNLPNDFENKKVDKIYLNFFISQINPITCATQNLTNDDLYLLKLVFAIRKFYEV